MAPLPPGGVDLHDLIPGDSPDSSLKYHPLKSWLQNTGCLRGFFPTHIRFSFPLLGSGRQGHFNSPARSFQFPNVCGAGADLGAGQKAPAHPCPMWPIPSLPCLAHCLLYSGPRSPPPGSPSSVLLSVTAPSHCSEIFALDFCLCPCLGQGPHALCSVEWGGFAPIQVPRASLLFLLSLSHCIPSCVNPSGWVKTLQ